MSLGSIIRNKREEKKLTLDEVSRQIGFSKPYLSTIETGRVSNPPGDELLVKLEKILGFEPGLLLHIAHMEKMPSDIREGYETIQAENLRWRQFIRNVMTNRPAPEKLDTMIKESHLRLEEEPATVSAGNLIPIINKVAAGYPADFDDLGYPAGVADDYVRCPDLHDPQAFAVRVIGDSMEPKFKEGDIVIFSPAMPVQSGDDCFVRFTMPHETTFKRIFYEQNDTIRLQPRNEKYAPLTVEGKRINGLYKAVIRYEVL
jgi:repressor LexA